MPRRTVNMRLSVDNESRQKARDLKLLRREISIAEERGLRRILCPCRVCNRGIRTLISHATVTKHIRWYGYHPYQRGSTEVTPMHSKIIWCVRMCSAMVCLFIQG